jgi:heme A synthase
MIHVVLIVFGKVIIDTLPGMTQQMSWTLVNLIYLAVSPNLSIMPMNHLVCSFHT